MRLINFLNENKKAISVDEYFIDEIKKKCSFYIDNFMKKHISFYRGDYSLGLDRQNKEIQLKQNRTPKGTDLTLFSFINKWLQNNKMNKRDESIIVTCDKSIANSFGMLFNIIPIGKFECM